MSLNYALSYPEIDRVIIGVESERQLSEIADATVLKMDHVFEQFSIDDERLLISEVIGNIYEDCSNCTGTYGINTFAEKF